MALNLEKVLISDEIDDECCEILRGNGIKVDKKTKLTKQDLITEIQHYDGLIVRSATKVANDVLAAATKLKIIGRAGTGVDNIDCNGATAAGIIVMNTPGGNTLSAAEHTCAMICSLSREIPAAVASLKAGKWERKSFMGNELNGKTLAIIGLGRIGRYVASRMQAFGMKTIGYDPLVSANESSEFGVEWLPLEEIWPVCDYITVHTPLIPQTKNLIGKSVFELARPGVRVVNVARGGIIDEDALLAALVSGQCGGAGLDVFTTEPPTNLDLINHPRVICTPHLGANTREAQKRVAIEIAEQFVAVKNGTSYYGAINAQAVSDSLNPECQPLISLASSLGRLAAALLEDIEKDVVTEINICGNKLEKAVSYVKAAFCSGVLHSTSKEHLNLVNAAALAESMGIKVTMTCKKATDCTICPSITVSISGQSKSITLEGVPSAVGPVLMKLDEARFESPFAMKGSVVIVRAKDTAQFLTSTSGAITNGNNNCLLGVSISSPVEGEVWALIHTANPISDTKPLRALSIDVIQVQFE